MHFRYLFLFLLLLESLSSNAQIIKAQRSSGTAPLGVHFTVGETDWEQLKNTDYEWIFPDGDTAIGFQAVHTFFSSGEVRLNITRADLSTYTETITITVTEPDVAYPATLTTCLSAAGDFSGCPVGASHVHTSDLSGLIFGAGQRYLFCRGDTFELSGSKTLYANMYLSGYGTETTNPVIRIDGDATSTTFWMQDSITVSGLTFFGSEWILSPAWGGSMYGEGRLFAPENHTTLHKLEVRNMTAFAIMDDGIGAKNNLVIDSVDAENLGSYFLYAGPSPSIQYSGIVHSRIRNVLSNHGIRLNGGMYFTAAHIAVDSVDRSHITYRGLVYGIVSDSRFTGKGFYKNSIRNISDDASVLDTVRYIIYERNRYASRDNEFALDFNIGSDIVVRNNLLLNSSFNIGINLSGVIPQRVDILHNTFYQDNYDWYSMIILRNGSTGVFKGNIAYADNCTGACIDENPFSSPSSEDSAAWKIDHNAYYVNGDVSAGNFKNGMDFSEWQVSGMDPSGTYGAMDFVNKTADLLTADFMPLSGVMSDLVPFITHRDLYGDKRNYMAPNDAGAIEKDPPVPGYVQERDRLALQMYPNPAQDKVLLYLPNPPLARLPVLLVDMSGRTLMHTVLERGQAIMHVGNLSPGLYFLRIPEEELSYSAFKLVKY